MYSMEDEFDKACDFVSRRSNYSKMDSDVLLRLYGCYKQATVGNCDGSSQPSSIFNHREYKKWKSWMKLMNISDSEAKRLYIETLNDAVPNWNTENTNAGDEKEEGNWIAVSTMSKEIDLPDSAKGVFDWVKEGDLHRLKHCGKLPSDLRDEEGLSLLHWAADRGYENIVTYLINEVKIDINCRDNENQTPLHYASACGHADISRLLIRFGADTKAEDNEGQTPKDVAETPATRDVFE